MFGTYSSWVPLLLICVMAAEVTACTPRTATRCHLPTDAQLAKIEVGESNRQSVVDALGTPSTVGTFDDQVWYYISRKTEKLAFFSEEVVDQQVIAIHFNDQGIVEHLEHYTKEDGR